MNLNNKVHDFYFVQWEWIQGRNNRSMEMYGAGDKTLREVEIIEMIIHPSILVDGYE